MRAEEVLASAGQTPLLRIEDVRIGSNCETFAFCSIIQEYLADNGNEIKLPGGSTCWSVELGNGVSQLYIYEESVDEETSVCDQCRIIGTWRCVSVGCLSNVPGTVNWEDKFDLNSVVL